MFLLGAALLLIPAAAYYFLSRRFTADPESRARTALRTTVLLAVGLTMAGPFLTRRAVGSGEAYNYSLAVADAVSQMRAGIWPPLVGQTEYAFNSRIHPLRNAPYLFYLAEGFDAATGHRLGAWELQNLSLAFSLMAAVFACYGALRWGTACSRPTALLFAAAYGFSPALLAAAYGVNLFMTVHAAVFVPLALGACLRQCRHHSPRADAVLAAALAAAWLAHPPVALWLTLAVVVVRGLVFLRYPTWGAVATLLGAMVAAGALAAFVFASVATISAGLGLFGTGGEFARSVYPAICDAYPGCLLPVGWTGIPDADFQLGYAGWALLLLLVAWLGRPGWPGGGRRKPRRFWAVAGSVAVTLLFLVLTLPIHGVTKSLWASAPVVAQSLTNVFPMQRLYLVATALVLFAAALVLPRTLPRRRGPRALLLAGIALGTAWICWEARPLISRGFVTRWTADATTRSYLSSNLDLTITSYAFLGAAPSFVSGVMDPAFEFRLLRGDSQEIDSNLRAAARLAPVVARGTLHLLPSHGSDLAVEPGKLILQPHQTYLLTFAFRTPPLPGELVLLGPSLSRSYGLPAAGMPAGFGMEPGNRRSISIWTSQDRPEEIELRFAMAPWAGRSAGLKDFADFTLQAVDLDRLPVRVESLAPLRCTVEAPEANCFVETPRRWLPGFAATINGRPVAAVASPTRQVMVPVPRGRSMLELRYVGDPLVPAAFRLSAASWLVFFLWLAGCAAGVRWRRLFRPARRALGTGIRRHRVALGLAAGTAALLAIVLAVRRRHEAYRHAFGPVRIAFLLPSDQLHGQQPLVETGETGAGTTVFVRYLGRDHIQIGADIWGVPDFMSDPLLVDYFQRQELVVDSSALYPLDHPGVRALAPSDLARYRHDLRVELNGRVVLTVPRPAYESKVSEVRIGENTIGSSAIDPRFRGRILSEDRLPVSQSTILSDGRPLRLRVRFSPQFAGFTEPLFALGSQGRDGVCAVTYLSDRRVRLTVLGADGSVRESGTADIDLRSEHHLEFTLEQMPDGSPAPLVRAVVDGTPVLAPASGRPSGEAEQIVTGVAPYPLPDMAARSVEPELAIESDGSPRVETAGPARLVVALPKGLLNRQEPLLVTGRAGRGDLIYAVYVDDRHLRLGYDHWGVSGGLSDPLPVDYDRPHIFVISLGSLFPAEGDPAWGGVDAATRHRLKSTLAIRLDGRDVFQAKFDAYPCEAAEIVAGANRIGGSTCDPAFSGLIYSCDRLGLPGAARP